MEMGSNLIGEADIHAKRKRVMVERLLKGREIATKLQTLINQPVDGLVSVEDLALQIFTSFSVTLSEVMSSCAVTSDQIAAVHGGGSACSSGESKKKLAGVKDRRGCYKRRKSSDSWMTMTPTMDADGYAWRKYGQKNIMNSIYPRCYYRCTHKDEGCKATKQVQILQEDPISYQTTYNNHHTCINTVIRAPQLHLDSDPIQPNLISFQLNPNMINNTSRILKKESKEDDHTQSDQDVSDDAKSSLSPWQEIIGLGPWGSRPEWDPIMNSYKEEEGSGFQSCGSTSLHGLDMEVNQLGDLDNFQYFDDIY